MNNELIVAVDFYFDKSGLMTPFGKLRVTRERDAIETDGMSTKFFSEYSKPTFNRYFYFQF